MATGNIDCPLPDRNSDFPNAFNFRYREDMMPMTPERAILDIRSAIAADSNNPNIHPPEETTVEILNNKCLNDKPMVIMNNNEHATTSEQFTDEAPPSARTLFEALGINVNDVLQWENKNFYNSHPRLIQSVIPEEQLHINIECGIESLHSWRPNMTNSLSTDCFLTQPTSEGNLALNLHDQVEDEIESSVEVPQLFPWSPDINHKQMNCKSPIKQSPCGLYASNLTDQFENEIESSVKVPELFPWSSDIDHRQMNCMSPVTQSPCGSNLPDQAENEIESSVKVPELFHLSTGIDHRQVNCRSPARQSPCGSHADGANESMVDIQSYLRSQKAQLNILKYEVMNTQRRINGSREEVDELSLKLKERMLFQNSRDITKLSSENAQLRLECQCLCMEVDFYVKGNAPLGEVDENFYKKNTSHDNRKELRNLSQPESQQSCDTEDISERGKWECSTCTFANHPAINSCEMCHMPRVKREYPTFPSSSPNSCFCHPKKEPGSS